MSMESVFSVLAGWVILGQKLSARELLGCALVFAAVICVQLPDKKENKAGGNSLKSGVYRTKSCILQKGEDGG